MKILIADDEQVMLDSLETGLKRYYSVIKALNGKEALMHICNKDSEVDMVITDYSMPGMNGLELLKEIREKKQTLPVIMMTAYGEKELVVELLRHKCDGFIDKPFVLEQLIKEIEAAKVRIIQNTDSHELEEITRKYIHQINNPLMSISGFAEISMGQLDDPMELKRNLKIILKGVQKIGVINRQILDLGKNQKAKTTTINIKTKIAECLQGFDGLLALKRIHLETDFGDEPVLIHANAFNMEQLFNNLILNAIDAMDGKDEKKLTITLKSLNSNFCGIYIRDTGCGISSEQRDKIFDSYYTSKKKGTGLGLSVVKDIVQSLEGSISIVSTPGKETTFILELPLQTVCA